MKSHEYKQYYSSWLKSVPFAAKTRPQSDGDSVSTDKKKLMFHEETRAADPDLSLLTEPDTSAGCGAAALVERSSWKCVSVCVCVRADVDAIFSLWFVSLHI